MNGDSARRGDTPARISVRPVDPHADAIDRVMSVVRSASSDSALGAADIRRNAGRELRHLVLLTSIGHIDVVAAELTNIESWDEPDGLWLWWWQTAACVAGAADATWEAIRAHCARHDVAHLRTSARDDLPDALSSLRRLGFVEVERSQRMQLTLREAPPPPTPPAGLTLVSLALRPDLLAGLMALDAETIPDLPGEAQAIPDREWWDERLAPGEIDPRTVIAALVDDRPIAYTILRHHPARPDVANVDYTATSRAWRGRGLAALVKLACHVAAWSCGVREIRTWNHIDNAPMQAVNARLGFEPGPTVFQMRTRIDTSSA